MTIVTTFSADTKEDIAALTTLLNAAKTGTINAALKAEIFAAEEFLFVAETAERARYIIDEPMIGIAAYEHFRNLSNLVAA